MNELTELQTEVAELQACAKRIEISATIAEAMCRASLLPEHLRTSRKKGVVKALTPEEIKANCIMVVNQAMRWKVDPFSILPSTFVVGGKLGFDGKLIAAIVNKLGGLAENLKYTFTGQGDGRTITVSGRFANEDEPRTVSVCVADAKTDNEIWLKDPDQKLVYTGATRWARRHCPEILLGIVTDDEPNLVTVDAVVSTSQPNTAKLSAPEIPDTGTDAVVLQHESQIEAATDRETLKRVVERVEAELAIDANSIEQLKQFARRRYAELSPPKIVADVEAILTDSGDPDAMRKAFALLEADDAVSPADMKRLGGLLNQRLAEFTEPAAS